MIKTAWAFIVRDCLLAVSYRAAFIAQIVVIFVGVSGLYFVGKVFDGAVSPVLAAYGGNYFAFLLIGIALTDFLKVSLSTFHVSIRENQMMGTLEMMLLSPVRLTAILIDSSLWSYIFATLRFLVYLLVGVLMYGFNLHQANLAGGVVMLLLSILCFSAFGIVTAAFIMVFKKGDPSTLMSVTSVFLGGVMFPASVLPSWLQTLAFYLPITHALNGMRGALIQGESFARLVPEMTALLVFTAILFPIGVIAFSMAVQRTKVTGTLGQY